MLPGVMRPGAFPPSFCECFFGSYTVIRLKWFTFYWFISFVLIWPDRVIPYGSRRFTSCVNPCPYLIVCVSVPQ